MADNTECTLRTGCGCSRCASPDCITQTEDWVPWERGFAQSGSLSGSSTVYGPPVTFEFTIYPGSALTFTPDQDWPEDSYVILDEEGHIVDPDVYDFEGIDPNGEDWELVVDPVNWELPGDYTGELEWTPVPGGGSDGSSNSQSFPVEVEIEEDPITDSRLAWSWHVHNLSVPEGGDSSTLNEAMVAFHRVCGNAPLSWSLQFLPDSGFVGTYPIYVEGSEITPGTTYGPISDSDTVWCRIVFDDTQMVQGNTYTGKLRLSYSYTDDDGATQTGTDDLRFFIFCGAGAEYTFVITDPGALLRGTSDDLEITAWDVNAGAARTTFDSRRLQLTLLCDYSPIDEIPVSYYDSEGEWTNGVLTIPNALNLNGGSGAQAPIIKVYDVFRGISGELELSVSGNPSFAVSFDNYNVTRGVNFDVRIAALDSNGDVDTSYTVATTVDLTLTSDDVGDSLSVTSLVNADFTNGIATVTEQITGGAGSDGFTIEAEDATTSRFGYDEGAIAGSETSISHSGRTGYYGLNSYSDISKTDWDDGSDLWDTVVAAGQAAFEADSSLASVSYGFRSNADNYAYPSMTGICCAGYISFSVSNPQKALSLKRVLLKIKAGSVQVTNTGGGDSYSWNPALRSLNIIFTESGGSFGSGAALKSALPDMSIGFGNINQSNILAGSSASDIKYGGSSQYIYIPIAASIINNLVGNTLYAWMYVTAGYTPYSTSVVASTAVQTRSGSYYCEFYKSTSYLILIT